MHKFSRSLLLAGIMAFGTAIVACDNSDTIVNPTPVSVSVTPPAATINVGESITLAASVTADENTAKTVTWTSSNAGTASVDGTGKVTGLKAGTVTITATSTADASKAAAAAITVNAGPVNVNPTIAINSVTQNGAPANLLGAAGQLDVDDGRRFRAAWAALGRTRSVFPRVVAQPDGGGAALAGVVDHGRPVDGRLGVQPAGGSGRA